MLREIINPTKQNVTLHLPEEMVGKTVEVIAFDITEVKSTLSRSQRIAQIDALTKNTLVDMNGYKFDRDEVNNYGD